MKKNKNAKFQKLKQAASALIATGVLSAGVGATIAINNKESDLQIENDTNATQTTVFSESSNSQNILDNVLYADGIKIKIQDYKGKDYYFGSAEYTMQLAQNSLDLVESTLKTVNGITPVGTNSGDFYPEYFDAYLLTAMAHTESSFRILDLEGNPVISEDGAVGFMQILPSTLDSVNNWLKNTMRLDIQYRLEDLSDPQKSMDIATFYLVQTCKNHGKENCNNPIYPYLDEEFSISRQEEIILALYNNGYANMIKYIKNGTVFNYLSEGNKTNYVNTVLKKVEQLKEKYPQLD